MAPFKTMIFRRGVPETAVIRQTREGRWFGEDEDHTVALADTKEECADKLSGVFAPIAT